MPKTKQKQKVKFSNFKKKLSQIISIFLLLTTIFFVGYMFFDLNKKDSKANGFTPTISPDTSYTATAIPNLSYSFTTSGNLNSGSLINLSFPSNYLGSLTTTNTTINSVSPSNVTVSNPTGFINYQLTLANSIPAGSTVLIVTTGITTPVSAANYPISFYTSIGDYGANFQYVGEANVVRVTGFIPVSLSFVIRNVADTANTNVCNFGMISTTTVATCQYRLKITTNSKNGYTVSMQASGDFTNGSDSVANAEPGFLGSGGSNIVAGVEKYGAIINPGYLTSSNGTINLAGTFYAGSTNSVRYNYTTPALLLIADRPNNPGVFGDITNTTLVTHNLGISPATASGDFTQSITYTVAPSF